MYLFPRFRRPLPASTRLLLLDLSLYAQVNALDADIKQARGLLLLFPDEVARSVRGQQGYMTFVMRYELLAHHQVFGRLQWCCVDNAGPIYVISILILLRAGPGYPGSWQGDG